MMKDGAKHYSGLEEAVYRNIEACKELAKTTRSAYGPHGQNKMVINHLEKLFVTQDAATILRELEVAHPAAKMLVMASQQQEAECGDGTNLVLVLAGALLQHAEDVLRLGLSVGEVIDGYKIALGEAHALLETLEAGRVADIRDRAAVRPLIRAAVMSKQYGHEDFLADLITDACLSAMPLNGAFNVDNVRVCKVAGAGVTASSVVQGMVFRRAVEGDVSSAENARVAVFSCPLDIMQTETKGTVLIKNAEELRNYSSGEEGIVEQSIKEIANAGVKLIVTGGKVGDLSLHYCNKYGLMVVRLMSKFDLRRLCKAIQATPLPRVTAPTPEECGHVDYARVEEIGDTAVVVFKQERQDTAVTTLVLRGATDNILDDMERAVDDGVNTYKAMGKDARYLAGAGACEMELAAHIARAAEARPGLEQYAMSKFAEALEAVPRALAENAGLKATEVVSKLNAAHGAGEKHAGVDVEALQAAVLDAPAAGVLDLYITKFWALKFATAAACTVLSVDQIIMAKAAGGPKPKEKKDWDEDD